MTPNIKDLEEASKLCDKEIEFRLEEQKKKVLEIVEGMKERFKCAACDGAKCEHTLNCQALSTLKEKIKEMKGWITNHINYF